MGFEIDKNVSASAVTAKPKWAEDAEIKVERPVVAPLIEIPKDGNDRYTVFVPTEHTTLSLGQKAETNKERHINDVGITGRTDTHVHLHVAKETKTLVSLGGGATSVEIESQDSGKNVPQKSVGYAMVTDENAWHDAKKQHYLVAREKDIVVRAVGEAGAATALLQADKGVATVAGGAGVAVGANSAIRLMSHADTPMETEPKYGDEGAVKRNVLTKVNESLDAEGKASTDFLKEVHDALKEAVKAQKKKGAWKDPSWQDVSASEAQGVLDALETLYTKLQELLKKETKGSIDLVAENHVSAHAGHVALYGTTGTSVTSKGTSELSGDIAAVAGKTTAAVWSGTHTSVKSGADVSIEAETGEVTLQGKKDVFVQSEDKGVLIQGNTDVQLNAKDGDAFVHGKTSAYIGAGGGAGYGTLATDSKVQVAKLSSANAFGGPGPADDEGIKIDSSAIEAKFKGSSAKFESAKITMESTTVEIKGSGQAKIEGAKILIG